MNKLVTSGFTGGFPFVLDDIRFLDDSYREGITMPLRSIGGDNFIISGCTYTLTGPHGYLIMNSGYVMLNGEILKVNGGNYNVSDSYFTKNVSYGSLGTKVSKDGTYTGSTYQICTAVPTSTATSLDFKTALRLNEIITSLAPKPTSWTTITTFYNGASSVSGVNALKYRNDGYGNIEIRGEVTTLATGNIFAISALSGKYENYYPINVIKGLGAGQYENNVVYLNTDGYFYFVNSGQAILYFNTKILL